MKSPYQIAKEIGVSPQAVYKRLTTEFINQLDNHIQLKQNGKYLLDDEAERILKELFNPVVQLEKKVEQSTIEPVEQPNDHQLNNENTFLKKRIEILEQELKIERQHSREQSDKIIILAEQLADLSRNNQILLGAEQRRTNPLLYTKDNIEDAGNSEKKRKEKFNKIQDWFKNRFSMK